MAWKFKYHMFRRVGDCAMKSFIQSGLAPKNLQLLTVTGRKTGMPHSTPVAIVADGAERWLVSPYGEVEWVKNARKAGSVTLTRGKESKVYSINELSPEQSAPVLKKYLAQNPITRPYFDAGFNSPHSEFAGEASRHPVFGLHE